MRAGEHASRTHVVGYFANSNGIFVGDEVRILGVPSARSTRSSRKPSASRSRFWYDDKYKVPADAKAVILSPSLVTARAIQLTPAYTGGPGMAGRRRHPAGPHRCSGRVGRLPPAAPKAHRDTATHPTRRGQHAGRFRQHRRRQPTRAGCQHPRHHHQAVPGVFRARRPQQRHLRHHQEPVDPGVGAARQHRPDAPAEPEPGGGDRAVGQRPQRDRQRRLTDLNNVVGDVQTLRGRQSRISGHHVGQAGVGHHGAQPRASTISSRRLHIAPTRFPELPEHLPARARRA